MSGCRILYLIERPLDQRDYQRLGVAFMVARGNLVTVIDVGDLTSPDHHHDRSHYPKLADITIHCARNRIELAHLHDEAARADLVILFVGVSHFTPRNLAVHRFVARLGVPYLIQFSNAYPGWSRYNGQPGAWFQRLRDRIGRLGEIRLLESLAARVPPHLAGVRAADFMVVGGKKCHGYGRLANGTTRYINAHAMDYELYRQTIAEGVENENSAVFIDEFLPFHPDLAMMGTGAPMAAEPYFRCLRALFDRIEKELNIEVVVAACPRADYTDMPDVFGDRRVEYFATARLVAAARLVIAHRSTAINYAILSRKPVLLTATRETYRHTSQTPYFDGFRAALEKPIQFFDDAQAVDLGDVFAVDDAVYDRYVEDYIKQPDSPEAPYWQIVADAVNDSGITHV